MDSVLKWQRGTKLTLWGLGSWKVLFIPWTLWFLVMLSPNSYALRFTLPLFCKVYIGGLGSLWNEACWQKHAHIHVVCSLTLSCTGLEAYSVWRQIPLDFCSFWNHFSVLFSAGRPWCLEIVPLSLPLGMFIKFPQSSLFSSPSPLAIVLASPLLNLSSVLIPDVPHSFCIRWKVHYEGLCIIFILRGALNSRHLLPKR